MDKHIKCTLIEEVKMSETRAVRYSTYKRRYDNTKHGYIKKSVLKQTAVCAVFLAAAVFAKENLLPAESFSHKAVSYILSENTDFKASWEEVKGFFKEQVEMTGLLRGATDFDPVRNMISPADGTVYRKFGIEQDAKSGAEEFCYGVKIKTATDEKVKSVTEGEVAESGTSSEYGNYILLKHSEKIYTFYAHLGEILVNSGDTVSPGQIIAVTANNEKEGFPMLYFEIRDEENMLDPETFIDFGSGGAS